jgi:hypothetical protein
MEHEIHLLWGTYTWILFHWMAEQIKDDYFIYEKDTILQYIINICSLLPCPSCREHARTYLSQNLTTKIKTKDDLKQYLFHFHNSVNIRSKKKVFTPTIVEQYKIVNIKLLLASWNTHFTYSNDIQRHDFMAKRNLQQFKQNLNTYLNENHYKFLMS